MDARVMVAVSASMAQLRRTQGVLNGFWQTSELAYGFLLSRSREDEWESSRATIDLLGHVQSEVWYPTNQGRIKREQTIGQTLDQIMANTVHVYRAAILAFSSAFEAYLEAEVEHLRPDGVRSWGEYVRSLSNLSLRAGLCPLPLRTVLRADFCREVRNHMVHEAFEVPTSIAAANVLEWKERLRNRACAAGWPGSEVALETERACHHVIGQAVKHVADAASVGKTLPIELFYMLFTFTNLDGLAFALEEALRPNGSELSDSVSRRQDSVRRQDLVVGPA